MDKAIKQKTWPTICALPLALMCVSCSIGNNNAPNIHFYQNWVTELKASQFTPLAGNVFLMQNYECPEFVAVFNSCFGQNPASPYIIPQPPVAQSYVDPDYATQFDTSGPDGTTNIFYRLTDNDALLTIVSYPPKSAYFGYQSYVFTSESNNYTDITPPRSRTLSPDPSRYDIFGSIGNDINNIIVQNQYGSSPWNGNIVVYISTSNQNLANALIANANKYGINPKSIFVEPIGANVITGNGANADDLLTLIRYAVPQNQTYSNLWESQLSNNVLVYKVTNTNIPVSRYGQNQYTAHTINTVETSLNIALSQLTDLLTAYLAKNQPGTTDAINYQTIATTKVNSSGIPESGLVGSSCIQTGNDCEGDNQDTSTYATLTESEVILGPEENAFIAGVNHSLATVNNNHYLSVDIYNGSNSSGVAGASQTNILATGFSSGILDNSATNVLKGLGIAIPQNDTELSKNINKLYVNFISRDCNNQTIMAINKYCINLMGTSLIPLNSPISITERSYVLPNSTTGGNATDMVYPYIIAGKHNFVNQ